MHGAASPVARECSDLDQFLEATRNLCQSDPGQNTRVIANSQLASATRAKGGALTQLRMVIVEQSAILRGAAITDALGGLGVSDMPTESAAALGHFLQIHPDFANGLAGPTAVVQAVLLHAQFSYLIKFNLMLHKLITTPNRGRNVCATRIATSSDQSLLVDWITAFLQEIDDLGPSSDLTTQRVKDGIANQDFLVAIDKNQQPIAVAKATQLAFDCARIGPVYTAPPYRATGAAQAIVADASAYAIKRGSSRVFLYTDKTNPASNTAYHRVGYRFISDHQQVDFKHLAQG